MHVGLSLMLDEGFREAAMPLFESGEVDVLEYSFELGWALRRPPWADALLGFYGQEERLWGHGVTYSTLSEDASHRQTQWLDRVRADCAGLRLRGVSEHFGFMGVDAMDIGAPLPPPPLTEAVRVGAQALATLADTIGLPVGLENLALALSPIDVSEQPRMLAEILDRVDGYLVLDLHNLWCQAVNFGMDPIGLMERYPLARARVLHVSGGSWSTHGAWRLRRDTHDARVPDEVFALVPEALARCQGLEAVILEQLGLTLEDTTAARGYRADFRRLKDACE